MFISRETAQAIVREMKRATGHDINFMDHTGAILASTDPQRVGQLHAGAQQVLSQGLERLLIQQDDPLRGIRQGVNLPIHMDGQAVGVVGITGAPEEVAALGSVIKRMTEILLRDTHRQAQETLFENARQAFVESWLFSEQGDGGELETRGRLLGIDTAAPWTVVVLEAARSQEDHAPQEVRNVRFLQHIRPYLSPDDNALCAVINQHILLMFRALGGHDLLALVDRIRGELHAAFSVGVWGGVSAAGRSGLAVRRCYQEARAACLAARSSGSVLFYNQVSLEFLARSIPAPIRSDLFQQVFGHCTPEEQKELLETIRLYFQYDGHVQRAADALYIHKNTFHYRLQKIKEKTGYSIRVPKESALLCLCGLFAQLEEN